MLALRAALRGSTYHCLIDESQYDDQLQTGEADKDLLDRQVVGLVRQARRPPLRLPIRHFLVRHFPPSIPLPILKHLGSSPPRRRAQWLVERLGDRSGHSRVMGLPGGRGWVGRRRRIGGHQR